MRRSVSGNTRGLSVVDLWSGYGWCVALRDGTTTAVAKALMDHWICIHSVPEEIQTDGGPEFVSKVMTELCRHLRIQKIKSSPYAPFSAGKVEKFNRTIKDTLAKDLGCDLDRWDEALPSVCFYYNISEHLTTNFAPFELAMGRLPTLPISLTLQRPEKPKGPSQYVNDQIDKMTKISRAVFETTRKNQQAAGRQFNKRLYGQPLEVDDLVRIFTEDLRRQESLRN